MQFKQWLERTLYHGTLVDNLSSIKRLGLFGSDIDDDSFVNSSYGDMFGDKKDYKDYLNDKEIPVFMTDKHELNRAVVAMTHHISKKLNKNFHDVTDNDIRNHGLLVIIHDPENDVSRFNPETDDASNYYHGLETDDYYSSGEVGSGYLHGNKLIKFLNKNGISIIPDDNYAKKIQGWQKAKDLSKSPLFKMHP